MRARLALLGVVALAACAAPAPPEPPEPEPAVPPCAHGEPRSGRPPGRVDVALLVERTGPRAALVRVEVEVEPGWRVYGLTSEYGVRPALALDLPQGVALDGPLEESPAEPGLALGELPITAHRGRASFFQRLMLSTEEPLALEATFTWQVCDEADTFCAPGRAEATLVIAGAGRAPEPWVVIVADERVRIELRCKRESEYLWASAHVEGRGDWTVTDNDFDVLGNWYLDGDWYQIQSERSRHMWTKTYAPAPPPGTPVRVRVRWTGRTAAGTPGSGEAWASLPVPPP
ncbi:MAG: hypothetical protein M9894_12530 [Planctomycetes bacterium]|nr:hypothetical protein [Planctomycetota bacterium]